MLIISKAEDRWMILHKQRADNLVNRRQEDVKDQGAEYPIGLIFSFSKNFRRPSIVEVFFFQGKAAAMIAGTLTTNDFRIPLDQKRQRRATEREARR